MGYAHILNLYKDQRILAFKRVFALEKIHGSSCHISWNEGRLGFFAGGCNYSAFIAIFDADDLHRRFSEFGMDKVTVYGEGYGGSMQKMQDVYGKDLKFIAFEVKIGETFLSVPKAHKVATDLGFEFVWYTETSADIDNLNAIRDLPSVQAVRNGMGEGKWKEGIVIRPIFECSDDHGDRVIAKHKNPDYHERKTQPAVSPDKLKVLADAQAIADEWVTMMRLHHVLDAMGITEEAMDIKNIGGVIKAMVEDVEREAAGEIVVSREARKCVSVEAAKLYKTLLQTKLQK